jgi:hypothetical protein
VINSFDYSKDYYRLREIYDEKGKILGDWKKSNARTGQFERWYYKLLGSTQKGGMRLTCKSIGL